MHSWIQTWCVCGVVCFGAAPAHALLLDFEELAFAHGDVVTLSQGVTITTENFVAAHPDLGVAFDTTQLHTADLDLQATGGWDFGNLGPNALLGNILIVQENDAGCDTGTCTSPDDEGARPAGSFSLDFDQLGIFESFSFDLVDVEDAVLENGSLQFLLGGNPVEFFSFASFLGLGQDVEYGNNSANHVDLGQVGAYDQVVITMGGSGGVDNILAEAAEPSAALLLLGVGLALVHHRRRRPATTALSPQTSRSGS